MDEDWTIAQRIRQLAPGADHIRDFTDTYAGVNLPCGYELHEKRFSDLYKRYMEFCWEMDYLLVDRATFYERLGQRFKIVRDYYKRGKPRKKPQNTSRGTGVSEMELESADRFIHECLEAGEDSQGKPYEVRTATVNERYKVWCDEYGFRRANRMILNARLRLFFTIKRKRPRSGGNATTMIVGGRLKEREEGRD